MKKLALLVILSLCIATACVVPTVSAYKHEMGLVDGQVTAGGNTSGEKAYDAITFLSGAIFDESSYLCKYMKRQRGDLSLDSNGKNHAPQVNGELEAAGISTKDITWRIYRNDYDDYNIFYTAENIVNKSHGDRIEYVIRYNTKSGVYVYGSSKVRRTKVEGKYINVIGGDTATEFIIEGELIAVSGKLVEKK